MSRVQRNGSVCTAACALQTGTLSVFVSHHSTDRWCSYAVDPGDWQHPAMATDFDSGQHVLRVCYAAWSATLEAARAQALCSGSDCTIPKSPNIGPRESNSLPARFGEIPSSRGRCGFTRGPQLAGWLSREKAKCIPLPLILARHNCGIDHVTASLVNNRWFSVTHPHVVASMDFLSGRDAILDTGNLDLFL
jgi:hypothetical protein